MPLAQTVLSCSYIYHAGKPPERLSQIMGKTFVAQLKTLRINNGEGGLNKGA